MGKPRPKFGAILRIIGRKVGPDPTQPETLRDKLQELKDRQAEYAKLHGVSVDAYQAARGDRWFPDWDARDRAWLPKSTDNS